MARSDPRPSVRVTRGAGSGQHLASVLQEGRENANIDAGLGFIWRISVDSMRVLIRRRFTDGFLDYHRGPSDYLVESVVWKNLERLQGLYYERPKSLWMIWIKMKNSDAPAVKREEEEDWGK